MALPASNINYKGFSIDIHNIAIDMSEGLLTEIKELFFLEGKYPPVIRWCSYPQNDWPKSHKALGSFWQKYNNSPHFTLRQMKADPNVKQIIPSLVMFKQLSGERDFAYAALGDEAARLLELPKNYQASLSNNIHQKNSVVDIFTLSMLMACAIRGQAMQVFYQDGTDQNPILWNNFTTPITNPITQKIDQCVMCLLRSE